MSLPTVVVRRSGALPARMVDASDRGLFLRLGEPLPVSELVKLRIQLPTGPVELHAVVVRVVDERTGVGIGFRFCALVATAIGRESSGSRAA